jgi:hypothetical protein
MAQEFLWQVSEPNNPKTLCNEKLRVNLGGRRPSQTQLKAHTANLAVTLAATRIKWRSPLIKRSCATSSINWDEMATIECQPAARLVRSDVKDAMTTE